MHVWSEASKQWAFYLWLISVGFTLGVGTGITIMAMCAAAGARDRQIEDAHGRRPG